MSAPEKPGVVESGKINSTKPMKPLSTQYTGERRGCMASVKVDGKPLPCRLDLRNHSPTGFEWGYGGSGPSQLALAILADFFGDDQRALALYQEFKWRAIAVIKDPTWAFTGLQIVEVLSDVHKVEE